MENDILLSVRRKILKSSVPDISLAEQEARYFMAMELAKKLLDLHCFREENEKEVVLRMDSYVASPANFWSLVEEAAVRQRRLLYSE